MNQFGKKSTGHAEKNAAYPFAGKVLTVAVPMYNVQKYAKKCLESFCAKGIKQVEVLVVDDGSLDRTPEIAKYYARKYPHLFSYIRKENGGHGSAVSTAIRYATGRYFMVVDGDDWVEQADFRALARQLQGLDADLAVSHYVRVKGRKEEVVYSKATFYETALPFRCLDAAGCYFVLPSICYRTELLKKAALRLPENSCYDDLVYMTKPMWLVQSVVFLNLAPYRYRVGLAAQSTSKRHMAEHYLQHRKMVCRLLADYRRHQETSAQKRYIRTVVCQALKDHYFIFLHYEPDIRLAADRLKQLDAFLHKKDAAMFSEVSRQIRCLKLLQKSGYRLLPAYRCCAAGKRLFQKVRKERIR